MIELKGVYYSYDKKEVFKDLNLKILEGERIVLLGPNGSGKTTLLKILNALLTPQKGVYLYKGREINEKTLKKGELNKWFRREVVLLFQNPEVMLFNPTVYDEIAFGLRQLGEYDEERIREEVLYWAERFGLVPFLRNPPFELSGGQKQRLCLACLLVLKPRVLLLDEPTANLDPKTTHWLIELLWDIDVTSIIATNNLNLAAYLGNKLLVLDENHSLVYEGNIKEFFEDRENLIKTGLLPSVGRRSLIF
ncbi:MAG: energy-coupling factor ABC transporter ATP-binding protein [Aquificaceae bacterium]